MIIPSIRALLVKNYSSDYRILVKYSREMVERLSGGRLLASGCGKIEDGLEEIPTPFSILMGTETAIIHVLIGILYLLIVN